MWYSGRMKRLMLGLMAVFVGAMMLGGPVMAGTPNVDGVEDAGGTDTTTTTTDSNDGCDKTLLLFRPWYAGLTEGADCKIATPAQGDEDALQVMVWGIVTNILYDLFVLVGYLATGFIIYAGYLYLIARGESSSIEKAKKTLIGAISGLIIAILAAMIVSFISGVVLGSLE